MVSLALDSFSPRPQAHLGRHGLPSSENPHGQDYRNRPRHDEQRRRDHGGQGAQGHRQRRGLAHHPVASSRGTTRARSSSARSPSARRSPTPRTRSTQRQALHRPPLRRGRRRDRSACRTRSCRATNGDAAFDVRGKNVTPARGQREGPPEAEEGRRGLPRREGHRGGHHRPRVLQRRPAPGDQGRRQASPASRSSASSTSRPRPRSPTASTRRRTRSSPSTTSAAARSTSRSSRSATTSCRSSRPTATRTSAATTSTT